MVLKSVSIWRAAGVLFGPIVSRLIHCTEINLRWEEGPAAYVLFKYTGVEFSRKQSLPVGYILVRASYWRRGTRSGKLLAVHS